MFPRNSVVPHLWRYCIAVVCLGLAAALCHGQSLQTSALHVTVKDAQGHAVPGAACSISLTAAKKTPAVKATSNEEGIATFANLAPGTYRLDVSREGFETLIRTDVVVGEKLEKEIAEHSLFYKGLLENLGVKPE